MARKPTGGAKTGNKNLEKSKAGDRSREDEILMREIDEAVRQDDTTRFFQRYGVPLGVLIVAVLASMFGYWWWESSREARLEGQSELIISALDSIDARDFEGASEKVDPLIDESTPGARASARFVQAAAAIEQGDTVRAAELYATIAGDADTPEPLRNLARIREVATDFDRLDPDEVIAKLGGLAQPDNAYFGSAGELVAIAHLEAGNRAEAAEVFAAIAQDDTLPETLQSRARQMAGLLGVDTIEDVDELLEAEGVGPASAPPGAAQQGAPPPAPPQ